MASDPIQRKWTVADYLAYELETDTRYEYIDGQIYAMSGGTDKHSIITTNTSSVLWQATQKSSCRVFNNDMRVKINDTKYLYPDVSVVCGQAKFADANQTMLLNPTVAIEVTSASSEAYDKGTKAEYYRNLSSVQAYLVIDQHRVYAQLSTRQEDSWLLRDYDNLDQEIPLTVLNYDLSLHDVYLDIVFER